MPDSSPQLHIQQDVPLAPYTTFGIGGPARYFLSVTDAAQLAPALVWARSQGVPVLVLGGGSNLLVSDSGFAGLVLHMAMCSPIRLHAVGGAVETTVDAGVLWDDLVLAVCQHGLSGVECLAGIPGTVGGTPVQNVGAYGQEVAETILAVHALDTATLETVTLPTSACGFSYRRSIFNTTQQGRYVVTQVTFRFDPAARPSLRYADLARHFAAQVAMGSSPTPLEVYHAVREIRHAKGMLLVPGEADCRSAGSFFKNPVVPVATLHAVAAGLGLAEDDVPHWPAGAGAVKLPAAWLLERAGFHKGYSLHNAGISSRHTLALINRGGATAQEVVALRQMICATVLHRFGIQLEQEPVAVGF
ncbi:MAG: UDP-N-acetylmuramate dehydrogenase [Acidobacteriota bacterium]|nr:UDP-N-acetylmuramate dehydrogenase [Acidobacteriota bacterium]